MKTLFSLLFLFSFFSTELTAQAQHKTYEEWLGRPEKVISARKSTSNEDNTPASAAPLAAPSGVFAGTVPCVDCGGISIELGLNGSPQDPNRSFTLKQIYAGKAAGTNIVVSTGKWFLAKGNKQDPEAVILQLIPKENQEPMYFQQVSDKELKMLNRQQSAFESKHNYTLKKQKS